MAPIRSGRLAPSSITATSTIPEGSRLKTDALEAYDGTPDVNGEQCVGTGPLFAWASADPGQHVAESVLANLSDAQLPQRRRDVPADVRLLSAERGDSYQVSQRPGGEFAV